MHTAILFAAIDFRDPIWQFWVGALSLLISAIAVLVTIILAARNRQRKLLTYEIISNTSVINVENDVGEDLEILVEHKPVTKVRLHVIRLMNAGNMPIEAGDYPQPLRFQFRDPFSPNPLIRCAISRTEPEGLIPEDHLKSLVSLDDNQTFIALKTPLLNPRDAIILRALLTARDRHSTQMDVVGQVKGGQIKLSAPSQRRVGWRTIAVAALVVALVLGFLINALGLLSSFTHGTCTFGSISVDGSTSFYNTSLQEAANYKSACPIASIQVSDSSSAIGLTKLKQGNTIQIANSELAAPASDNFKDNPVAVIVFALIINKKSLPTITNLTTTQIQGIYQNQITNWSQVDPKINLPIKVYGRGTGSGTHAAFLKRILGGQESLSIQTVPQDDSSTGVANAVAMNDGAIGYTDLGDANNTNLTTLEIDQSAPLAGLVENGTYQFWAIEHMYTQNNPDGLATSFITYVIRDMQGNTTFIRLDAMNPGVLASRS